MISTRVFDLVLSSFFQILLPGIFYTIPLTIASFGCGMVLAIAAALARSARIPVLEQICRFYVWVFRGTPLLVQLFVIFYGLPSAGIVLPAVPSAIIAFSLNCGAYMSETIRGSIEAVDKGQTEAGLALGLGKNQALFYIVLPQALKNSIPALFNTLISLVKDTSLAANITVAEMFMATQRIAAVTYEPLVMYLEVGFIYLMFCSSLSALQRRMEISKTNTAFSRQPLLRADPA
jgi:cystine transport system permease protein